MADLDIAEKHVRRGQIIVDVQKARLAELEATGRCTADTKKLLSTFEASLRILKDYRDALRKS